MIAKAVKRYERTSAMKIRRMLRLIKGQGVPKARGLLQFLPSRSRITVLKTLNSAVANLKNKVGTVRVEDSDLFVKDAFVWDGPQMKRWRPGFRGSADMIRKRTCHITLIVGLYKPLPEKKGE